MFSVECVLYRMCFVSNALSVQCVLDRMCSLQNVFSTERVVQKEHRGVEGGGGVGEDEEGEGREKALRS